MSKVRRETLVVPQAAAGVRLDLWLVQALGGVSRKAVKKALDGGQVFVAGRCERRAGTVLRGGEIVVATVEAPAVSHPPPELVVLYRDAQLLAIAKPANLPAHPTVAGRGNALDQVKELLWEEGGTVPPILLHRLDADTTGVLLFALTVGANRHLYGQFVEHTVAKVYLALVGGAPPAEFSVSNHLKAGVHGRTVAVTSGGQPAQTAFRTLQQLDGFALVEARPQTGRTHQIRAHLAGAGFPLLGDSLYGGLPVIHGQTVGRHLLHATSLTVTHPLSGERLTLAAPLPEDFQRLLGGARPAGE